MVARSAAPAVELPRDTVTVEALGGDVLVQGMGMPELLRFFAAQRRLSVPRAGESQEMANERANAELVPILLSMCVLADDDLRPLWTEAEWRAWGTGKNATAALALFAVAMRISGQNRDEEKKT